MVGLIFSAGYGKRLGRITKTMPKCMIKVAGKPCLERIVSKIEALGVDRIIVNTHWLPLKIMEYFGERLLYTFEPELLGEGNTLKQLKNWLAGEYVILANGDTLSDVSLKNMLELSIYAATNVRFMDNGVYAGYSVLHPSYFDGNQEFVDYEDGSYWVDIGTPAKLKEANEHFSHRK